MVTVMWNPLGFHVIDKLPTGARINNDYFTTNILVPLEQKIFPSGRKPHAKRVTIHRDNCPIQTSKATEVHIREHNMMRLKHPPYSPDRAPSDFCLFLTIKEKLKDIRMVDEGDLFERLHELLKAISPKELDKVFGIWINRLMIVSQGDGVYIS
jgi:hypothetical protein